MSAKVLENDSQFQVELNEASAKLVVVDFFATWCNPCHKVAPFYDQLATKYSRAVFLKVDVDKCSDTAQANGISAMPTFLFFRNKVKVDSLRGADTAILEEKVKKWYDTEEDGEGESAVKGHMDLCTFITKSSCECLNESDEHPLAHCLVGKGGYLESDCDEQLIISMQFNQPVKLHSLRLNGPPDKGPKTVKLFVNQPKTLDFDSAERMEPIQALDLTPEDLIDGALLPLRFVKFQNVICLTLFVKNNQGGTDTTQINRLAIIGSPVSATDMAEFKRVAGKKGESH